MQRVIHNFNYRLIGLNIFQSNNKVITCVANLAIPYYFINIIMEKLLGDATEQALKKLGADKIAKYYERTTGRPCNCANRKQVLNNLHRAAQRMIERQSQPSKLQQSIRPQVDKNLHVPPTKPVDEQ